MKPTRVLLADTYPIVQEGLKSLLTGSGPGWEICGLACNGLDVVARAVHVQPDIVIMDDEMPHLSGLEAALEIKRRAPIVGARSPAALRRLYRSEVRGCFLKSDPLEELIPALETVRRHHRYRSEAMRAACIHTVPGNGHARLIPRELEILSLIGQGKASKEIAAKLGVSQRTIENHRNHLFRKLNVHSAAEAMLYAIENELVERRRIWQQAPCRRTRPRAPQFKLSEAPNLPAIPEADTEPSRLAQDICLPARARFATTAS